MTAPGLGGAAGLIAEVVSIGDELLHTGMIDTNSFLQAIRDLNLDLSLTIFLQAILM